MCFCVYGKIPREVWSLDISLVEKSYGFNIKSMEKIKRIYRVKTDKGVKCVKRVHMRPSYYLFLFTAVEHLKNKGFEGVVPYNLTVNGEICLHDEEYIYYVTDWIESKICKFKRETDLIRAIKSAAELHKASIGYVPPTEAKPRVYYNKWVKKFDKKCYELLEFKKKIEDKDNIDRFDEIFLEHFDYYYTQATESINMLKSSCYEELSLLSKEKGEFCHHDMANHNFLLTQDNRTYLIDFDYCIMDTRLHDISSLIIRNMRYGIWDVKKAYFILREYSKYYNIITKELEVIKAFITFPQDYWQVGLQYYVEKQAWTMDYFLARINKIVGDRNIRHRFLEQFLKL